ALAACLAACGLALAACTSGASGASAPGATGQPGSSMQAGHNPALDTGSSLGGVQAPDFRLVNQFGQRMSLSQFRGKVVVLAFIDSECTNICPLTTVSMVEARQLLGAAGSQVQLLGVDANPQATSVSDVMAYSRAHGMVNQWDFLTGTLPQLQAAWRGFHIAVQIERGMIDHTPALFVIDAQGRERTVYLTQMNYASIGQAAQVLAQRVASLLPGRPPLAKGSLAYIPGLTPAKHVTLPGVPSGSVTLGPGRPRLVMFFATWVAETSNLRAHLLALNSYARAARHGRLPGLVAVDEATTEPSPGAAAAYLKDLGAPLRYPMAADPTGRVADGYGAADQPWFALVSATGKVIWKHDGWLGIRALEAAARRA
ncbi:MAG: SCO family protein, partial [Actinobacteria bacterium]|nr:SCO family protein [Actinomycetota bacterium]